MQGLELRPLSLGELLDQTFTLYRSRFLVFVGIMAVPQLFVLAANFAQEALVGVSRQVGGQSPSGAVAAPSAGAVLGVVAVTAIGAILFLAGYVLAQAATVFAVSEIYLGRPASIRQAYARVRGKAWRLLLLFVMISFAALAGFVLLVIPGILVLLATALAVPAAVLEDRTARAALSRSTELTKGNWGRIFLIWLLFFILQWVAVVVLAYPFAIAQMILLKEGQHSLVLAALSHLGSFLGTVLVAPLVTIALSLLYYDVRIRKEAFDLEVMMAALGPPATSPLPPAVTGA